jgi:hypothetical protein
VLTSSSFYVGVHRERMCWLVISTARGLAPRTPRESGRRRHAVKGESPR